MRQILCMLQLCFQVFTCMCETSWARESLYCMKQLYWMYWIWLHIISGVCTQKFHWPSVSPLVSCSRSRPLWSQGGDQLPSTFEYFSCMVKMDPASGCPKISIKPVLSREQLSADFILLGEKWKLLQSGTCNMQNEQERIGGEMMKSIGKKKRSMKEKQQQRALWILYRRKPCTDKENSVYHC